MLPTASLASTVVELFFALRKQGGRVVCFGGVELWFNLVMVV